MTLAKALAFSGAATSNNGYNAAGDLVTQTVDGFDLNNLWNEFQTTVAMQNESRQRIIDLLTYPVTSNIERVAQISQGDFELASEYGEPRGIRPSASYFTMGYSMDAYDLAARFTWMFLANAPANQIQAINAMALEADNRLIYTEVMKALYRNTNRLAAINGQDVNVYSLYNADGTVPPKYKTNSFDGTHNHYLTSGASTIDPGDVDDLYEHLRHHGYSIENGTTLLLLVNETEAKQIRKWRISIDPSTGLPTAGSATWDFIPAVGSPTTLMPEHTMILGTVPGNIYAGLNVTGQYGPFLVIVDDLFPSKYVTAVATGGAMNLNNPVGIREHENPSLRGLRLVKGATPDYPLIDSFYQRMFGTGIRQRGGAAVMQITANATYTAPTF